jgi:Protein of unknown function (DUF3108)
MSPRMRAGLLVTSVAVVSAIEGRGASGEGQGGLTPARGPRVAAQVASRRPWVVGEKLTYDAKVNFLHVGSGTMTVVGLDTLRGYTVWHTTFQVKGRMLFFSVNDTYESWFDTTTLSSIRYRQDIDEGSYEPKRLYEFFPDRATFQENDKPEEPSVSDPLDEGSFIYFLRSIPLDTGQTYEFHRYFRPDRNPVQIKVLRRERIKVQAGEFDAFVLQPIIKTKGIFSENGKAQIWIADDSTRVMLKMRSGLPFGTLNLELKRIENVAPQQ